jgi:hypothetical protein
MKMFYADVTGRITKMFYAYVTGRIIKNLSRCYWKSNENVFMQMLLEE